MCIEVQMPFYLALLDANGARGIQAQYPEIENWYIGGHSLGGAMASLYVGRHVSEYEGRVLLASYPATDLRDSDLDVLSIRGTNDGVLNMKHYDKNLTTYATMNDDRAFTKMPPEIKSMHERRQKLFGLLLNINGIIEDKLFKLYE